MNFEFLSTFNMTDLHSSWKRSQFNFNSIFQQARQEMTQVAWNARAASWNAIAELTSLDSPVQIAEGRAPIGVRQYYFSHPVEYTHDCNCRLLIHPFFSTPSRSISSFIHFSSRLSWRSVWNMTKHISSSSELLNWRFRADDDADLSLLTGSTGALCTGVDICNAQRCILVPDETTAEVSAA